MGYFKIIQKGEEPNRLFIGGVHGKEGESTIKALNMLSESDLDDGKLVIYNCDQTPYLSTLKPEYYESEIGQEILYLINYYLPEVYIEIHCYKRENLSKLTNPNRLSEEGVPPLIELDKGILIGSVSPLIRTTLFKRDDICMTLEMPCKPKQNELMVLVSVLKIITNTNSREALENSMMLVYPEQVKTAINYAREFFGDYPPF
jgi:hypothetical protein